ncbi:NAD(P)-binding protein [Irpex rosettiformis]|uniref:NAD(P)-binding protein n=1 Tax=Irpex rosettiformis TaxID=378272 RepID=A0ACB8U3M9_9APHY|nr:NAD(P)-binding protein [Irpex rosettiformis]
MPAVQSGKVLVSGANGYIAVWLVKKLLDEGYSVRGTVRSASKGVYLSKIFASYGDKFELVVVEDITKDGAFDEAVKGVDAIEHTASPFHFKADDPNELIIPAIHGTRSILVSALKYGTNVKRVVITSSCAAVLDNYPEPRTFSEKDWNEGSSREVQEKGREAAQPAKYRASKTLAERAAWDFIKENKDQVKFDLAVINPPFVYGPVLHEVDKPEDLNTSAADWFTTIVKATKDDAALVAGGTEWVDVRDVALAHVLALQKEEAGGERIIVSSGKWVWQDWVAAAHKIDPTLSAGNTAHDPATAVYRIRYDVSKAARIFGIKYITLEQTTKDTLAQYKEKGWY